MTPQELCDAIRDWATSVGYEFLPKKHSSEYARVSVRDPGGQTGATVPNPHKGRRLRRDQVRYTVRDVNKNWRE